LNVVNTLLSYLYVFGSVAEAVASAWSSCHIVNERMACVCACMLKMWCTVRVRYERREIRFESLMSSRPNPLTRRHTA